MKPTVWEALNHPVIEVTPEAAKAIFTVAAFVIAMAWLTPYMPAAASHVAAATELGLAPSEYSEFQGLVAGANTEDILVTDYEIGLAPQWYDDLNDSAGAVAGAFVGAASEVLDVSTPAQSLVEFYQPGVSAVWNAWLELMQDPEF